MITIFFHVRVKSGLQSEFDELASLMTLTTHAEDDGCMAYVFYRRTDDPSQVVLYEQWRDTEALSAHLQRLQRVLGLVDGSGLYPPTDARSRLPKRFADLLEDTDVVRYEPVVP